MLSCNYAHCITKFWGFLLHFIVLSLKVIRFVFFVFHFIKKNIINTLEIILDIDAK